MFHQLLAEIRPSYFFLINEIRIFLMSEISLDPGINSRMYHKNLPLSKIERLPTSTLVFAFSGKIAIVILRLLELLRSYFWPFIISFSWDSIKISPCLFLEQMQDEWL